MEMPGPSPDKEGARELSELGPMDEKGGNRAKTWRKALLEKGPPEPKAPRWERAKCLRSRNLEKAGMAGVQWRGKDSLS